MPTEQLTKEPQGLMTRMSRFDQTETVCHLHDAVTEQHMGVVAEIDHAEAARVAGLYLRPTKVRVFGNALVGTTLIRNTPTIGIDLPLKVLVWTEGNGMTWFAYNDPGWLAARHGAPPGTEPGLDAMRRLLTIVVDRATSVSRSNVKGG